MIEVRERHGGSVIALHGGAAGADPPVRLRRGPADGRPDGADADVVAITDLVEKPARRARRPSNLAVIGRYVLDPAVFDVHRGDRRRAGAARSS